MSSKAEKADVCVVGLGYIGLPTAVFFARAGKNVIGLDISPDRVEMINAGNVPFTEPGFDDALREVLEDGTFAASTEVPRANAYIVAVPTPFNDDHSVDDRFIRAAARSIAPRLEGGDLVVLESTSPPGTTKAMADELLQTRPELALSGESANLIFVAHCPERVIPGSIMVEMPTNDRVVGGLNDGAAERAKELYASFCEGEIVTTDAATAEMAKLTENSFRDVNIAFANELSVLCDKFGINVWELIAIANRHPRVNVLEPGPGVGGHCIAVDPWFIVAAQPESSKLIRAAREVNDAKPRWVISKIDDAIEKSGSNDVAVLGLAFKADIDDLRESPALAIAEKLAETHPKVRLHIAEPNIDELPESLRHRPNVTFEGAEEAVAASGVVALLVSHHEFLRIDATELTRKAVVDTRGLWDEAKTKQPVGASGGLKISSRPAPQTPVAVTLLDRGNCPGFTFERLPNGSFLQDIEETIPDDLRSNTHYRIFTGDEGLIVSAVRTLAGNKGSVIEVVTDPKQLDIYELMADFGGRVALVTSRRDPDGFAVTTFTAARPGDRDAKDFLDGLRAGLAAKGSSRPRETVDEGLKKTVSILAEKYLAILDTIDELGVQGMSFAQEPVAETVAEETDDAQAIKEIAAAADVQDAEDTSLPPAPDEAQPSDAGTIADLTRRLVTLQSENNRLQQRYDALAGSRLGSLTLKYWARRNAKGNN